MDDSFQVGAGGRAGRIEAGGEQRRRLLTAEGAERDLGAGEDLCRLGRLPGEAGGGEFGVALRRAEHQHDSPPQEARLVRELAEEDGVLPRGGGELSRQSVGGSLEPRRVRGEAGRFAAHRELNRLRAAVEEAGEAIDEGGLLDLAAQLEARPACLDEKAVAAVGELDEPIAEDAPDRDVERRGA